MDYKNFQPGRVFVVPLLGGGYAYGYFTYFNKHLMTLGNIFDFWSESATPPSDIADKPIIMFDLTLGAEFLLSAKSNAGERWKITKTSVPGAVTPRNRYFRMGGPPRSYRRIDILGKEPDLPLSPEEAAKYPAVSKDFPPTPTAQVEIAVKRLLMSSAELIKSWRARKPQ